jgi:hypothetical protein
MKLTRLILPVVVGLLLGIVLSSLVSWLFG